MKNELQNIKIPLLVSVKSERKLPEKNDGNKKESVLSKDKTPEKGPRPR